MTYGRAADSAGYAYWVDQLGARPTAAQILSARASIVGQFVHDMLSYDLTVGQAASGLSPSEYAAALARQTQLENKVQISQAFANESALSGSPLNFTSTTDAALLAAQHLILTVTSDPATVTAALNAINLDTLAAINSLPVVPGNCPARC